MKQTWTLGLCSNFQRLTQICSTFPKITTSSPSDCSITTPKSSYTLTIAAYTTYTSQVETMMDGLLAASCTFSTIPLWIPRSPSAPASTITAGALGSNTTATPPTTMRFKFHSPTTMSAQRNLKYLQTTTQTISKIRAEGCGPITYTITLGVI